MESRENFGESPDGYQNFPDLEFNLGAAPADYSNFLDMRQPWDGNQPEVSLEERQAVASLFSSKVDDMLWGNIENAGIHAGNTTDLHLTYTPKDSGHELKICILRNEAPNNTLRVITVSRDDGEEACNYGSEPDGTIIRTDLEEDFKPGRPSRIPESIAFADDDTPEIRTEKQNNYDLYLEQEANNYLLSKHMGFAAQPISLDEAQRLCDLLDNSVVINK